MNAAKARFTLRLEQLEERDAPSTLTITPPAGPATPAASTVADSGCTSGITPFATPASSNVVQCS
jgi:hypothetical protein